MNNAKRRPISWVWGLPVIVGCLWALAALASPYEFEALRRHVPPELAARGITRLNPGTGYSCRTGFVTAVLGGPFVLVLSQQEFYQSYSLAQNAARVMLLPSLSVVGFWAWVGWLIDTRDRRFLPSGRILRLCLALLYMVLSYLWLLLARHFIHLSLWNGAGEIRTWSALFSMNFTNLSLNEFVHGVWFAVLFAYFVLLTFALWLRKPEAV